MLEGADPSVSKKGEESKGGEVLLQSVLAVWGGAGLEEADSCGTAAARLSSLEGRSARWRRCVPSGTAPCPGWRPAARSEAPAAALSTPARERSTVDLKSPGDEIKSYPLKPVSSCVLAQSASLCIPLYILFWAETLTCFSPQDSSAVVNVFPVLIISEP